jgi:hypothetical protein
VFVRRSVVYMSLVVCVVFEVVCWRHRAGFFRASQAPHAPQTSPHSLPLPLSPAQVRPLAEPLVAASVELYRTVARELLPTPSKSHYLFNTRDLAKLILGVMQASI